MLHNCSYVFGTVAAVARFIYDERKAFAFFHRLTGRLEGLNL